jgi:hypothetical protein
MNIIAYDADTIFRRYLLLTAEGWIYLILSGIELLSDVVPAVRDNLSLFRGFDVGLGAFL